MLGDSVVVRGAVGVGKSTTVWVLNELLMEGEVPHAALDLDWLSASWPRFGPWNLEARHANTAVVAQSYRSMGIEHFAVAGMIENQEGADRLRVALGAERLSVCRLQAPLDVIEERLRGREDDESLQWFLDRAAVLDAQLAADGLDDVVLDATRPVRDVARELAGLLSWS